MLRHVRGITDCDALRPIDDTHRPSYWEDLWFLECVVEVGDHLDRPRWDLVKQLDGLLVEFGFDVS